MALQAGHPERLEHGVADLHHAADRQVTAMRMDMRHTTRWIVIAALAAVTVSCGDVSRQGSSPVYLVIDSLTGTRGAATIGTASNTLVSDVITNVTSPAPCTPATPCPTIFSDPGSVTLRAPLKDIG